MRLFVGALALSVVPPVLAVPEGPLLKLVCQSAGAVLGCRCPQLDPSRTRLVAIKADLHGHRTLEFIVQAAKVQDVTVNAAGNMLLDPGFAWPASASTTIQAGPMLSSSSPKTGTIDVKAKLSKVYTDKGLLDSFRGTGDRMLTSSNDWKISTPTPGAQAYYTKPTSNVTSVRLEYSYRPLLVPNAPIGSMSMPVGNTPASAPKGKAPSVSLQPKTVSCTG